MSRSNYIGLTCDRCGFISYHPNPNHAINVGWGFGVEVEETVDLCPRCYGKWCAIVHDFMCGEVEED